MQKRRGKKSYTKRKQHENKRSIVNTLIKSKFLCKQKGNNRKLLQKSIYSKKKIPKTMGSVLQGEF